MFPLACYLHRPKHLRVSAGKRSRLKAAKAAELYPTGAATAVAGSTLMTESLGLTRIVFKTVMTN